MNFKGQIIYFLKDQNGCVHMLKKKSKSTAPLDEYLRYVQSLKDEWNNKFVRAYVINLEESDTVYIWSSEDWRYDLTNKISKYHQKYLDFIRTNRKDLIFLGPYISNISKGNHLCSRGHEWFIQPSKVMAGEICPKCKKTKWRTFKAEYITELLSNAGIEFIKETNLKRFGYESDLYLDFLVCKNHHPLFAIEYNGVQHYNPIRNAYFQGYKGYKKRRKNDQLKRYFCWNNGLPVIDIPYNETKEQIKETVYYFLHLFDVIP